ncbi:MAG: hypothetical protein JRN10_00810 [Nitrososphaerota archaeon]|jgi:hypothetical protein|nr:hypothetical protein [Nitrososphaerota archaeon]MDG6929777.1 hypothetical protein [Nitrososphaerota archaeon]
MSKVKVMIGNHVLYEAKDEPTARKWAARYLPQSVQKMVKYVKYLP